MLFTDFLNHRMLLVYDMWDDSQPILLRHSRTINQWKKQGRITINFRTRHLISNAKLLGFRPTYRQNVARMHKCPLLSRNTTSPDNGLFIRIVYSIQQRAYTQIIFEMQPLCQLEIMVQDNRSLCQLTKKIIVQIISPVSVPYSSPCMVIHITIQDDGSTEKVYPGLS